MVASILPRLQRYALILSGYNYDIVNVKSEINNALPLQKVGCNDNEI